MDILPPALKNISALGNVFPPLRLVRELWKISVFRSDDVVWCTILAYLKSFSSTSKQEFKNRLKLLLGNSKVGKTFISHLKNCNLFLGGDARLYEEVVRDLIFPFTEKIKSFISEQKKNQLICVSKYFVSFETFDQKFLNISLFPFKEIQAAATLLSHDIVVISYTDRLSHYEADGILIFQAVSEVRNFEFNQSLKEKPNLDKCIFLFHTSVENRHSFSIGLRKDVGLDMQKFALREILKSQTILSDKHIKRISSLEDISDNFLIALIKNRYENRIPGLLQSAYISKKLYSAGFKIDPRTKNKKGFNALSYALCLENSYCLFFLYEFAANSCLTGESSIRCPDLLTVKNLMSLKECLTELMEVITDPASKDISRARIEELLKLNSFQIIICQQLNEAHKQFGEASQEVLKRKSVILRILKTYDDYFHWNSSDTDPEYGLSCLKENLNHIHYLDNLDFYCAVLFFDNFFLLKEKLKLERCLYLKTESMIFRKLFCTRFFKYCEERNPSDLLTFRLTTWQMREELLKVVRHFCECVEKRKICHDNLRTCVPDDEVKTLTNLPELYDEFFLNRLQTYLNIATNITIKDQKSILVIERALQVIGESVKDRLKIESLQNVIAFGLPKELVVDLKRIRNQLSRLEPEQIPWRCSVENSMELLESVRSELRSLSSVLQPVFYNQEHRLRRFIYLQIIKAINKAAKEQVSEKYASCLKEIFSSSDESNNFSNDEESCKFQRQWEEHLNSIYFSVQREIKEPKPVLMKGSTIRYKYILKNMFISVRNKLDNIKTEIHDNDDFKNLLNEYFLPLECFMDFIATDDFLNDFRRTFLKKVKARRSFCQIKKRKKIQKSSKEDLSSDYEPLQKNTHNRVPKEVTQTNEHECQIVESTTDNTGNSQISCESDSSSSKMSENYLLKRNEQHSAIKPLNSARDQNKAHERDPEISNFISKAEKILTDYHVIYENFFQNAYHIVKENIKPCFPYIHELRKILFGKAYLKEKYKKEILRDVESTNKAVRKLKDTVYNMKLTSDEVKSQLLILRFKEKDWSEMIEDYQTDPKKFLSHIEPISKILAEFKYVMKQNEMDTKQYKKFCDKLDLSEESKKILTTIVIGYKEQTSGDPLRFLSNRIKLLKRILIEEHKDVLVLWEKVSNEKSKDYTYLCEKFLQLYLKEPEVRLSVETLLFDCMNLLKNEHLQALLRKSTNLFNGINLRNVLAHGDPLLEVLSHLLEPNDLASELVKKILQLILDDEIIDIMLRICSEAKADYTQFMSIMNDETGQYTDLCVYIRQSENWKEYAKLIPTTV